MKKQKKSVGLYMEPKPVEVDRPDFWFYRNYQVDELRKMYPGNYHMWTVDEFHPKSKVYLDYKNADYKLALIDLKRVAFEQLGFKYEVV